MTLGRAWAGNAFGTNTGLVFLRLEGPDDNLSGTLHFSDSVRGIIVLHVKCSFDGSNLIVFGESPAASQGEHPLIIKAELQLTPHGLLSGGWQTTNGLAGTLVLHPHESAINPITSPLPPSSLHTARHLFGAIEIDREGIIRLAEVVQKGLINGSVFVSVTGATEQTETLEHFKNHPHNFTRAKIVRIFGKNLNLHQYQLIKL